MAGLVILSYGLGVDSTAILLRWLTEPSSRDFELADLTVITAMTGDEWRQTGLDVEAHVLPLLAAHGVRYIQVARGQRHVTTPSPAVVTLDDSTEPARLYLEGAFKLSQEMLEAGTVPQTGGARLCSVHSSQLQGRCAGIGTGISYLCWGCSVDLVRSSRSRRRRCEAFWPRPLKRPGTCA